MWHDKYTINLLITVLYMRYVHSFMHRLTSNSNYGIWKWHVTPVTYTCDTCGRRELDGDLSLSSHPWFGQAGMFFSTQSMYWNGHPCPMYNIQYTGWQPSYRDIWNRTAIKSVPTSFRSIVTHYFLYKYIVWTHIFISLLSSVFSSTLLIACTISVVTVWCCRRV